MLIRIDEDGELGIVLGTVDSELLETKDSSKLGAIYCKKSFVSIKVCCLELMPVMN